VRSLANYRVFGVDASQQTDTLVTESDDEGKGVSHSDVFRTAFG